jgi:hypothetical protein
MSEFSALTDGLWEECLHKARKDGQYAVAVALFQIAKSLNDIVLGSTYHPGAIEGHTIKMMESISSVSSNLELMAMALDKIANAIEEKELTS